MIHAENIKDHALRFQGKQNETGVEKTESDCLDPLRGDIHTHGKMEMRGRREQTHLWQTVRVREWAWDLLSGHPSMRGNGVWEKLRGNDFEPPRERQVEIRCC